MQTAQGNRFMENSATFKPVFWRLLIFRFIPFYIGWTAVDLIYRLNKHFPITLSSMLLSACALFLGITIGVFLTRKKFNIEISHDFISGPSGSMILTEAIIPVSSLDILNFNRRSFYEKISGVYSIRSKNGTRIIFTPFIYGKATKDKVYKILMQNISVEQ